MKKQIFVKPSKNSWLSRIVLVTKNLTKFCVDLGVDYRKLNIITKKYRYSLTKVDNTLNLLTGSVWFITLDLKSGYWQVEFHPDDQEKLFSYFRLTLEYGNSM